LSFVCVLDPAGPSEKDAIKLVLGMPMAAVEMKANVRQVSGFLPEDLPLPYHWLLPIMCS
jgi:hypothetical protein